MTTRCKISDILLRVDQLNDNLNETKTDIKDLSEKSSREHESLKSELKDVSVKVMYNAYDLKMVKRILTIVGGMITTVITAGIIRFLFS